MIMFEPSWFWGQEANVCKDIKLQVIFFKNDGDMGAVPWLSLSGEDERLSSMTRKVQN